MPVEIVQIRLTQRGARTVKRSITGVGSASKRAGSAVRTLQRALLGLGVGLTLVSAVNTLRTFAQEINTVRAITKATEQQFRDLTAVARELGATTRFSASEAAGGLTFLARAGFDAQESIEALPGTLQLAQAGALSLARAADIASNVLQGFRLEIVDTARVVDVLALTANSSNTNVEQLGDAMKFVAPVAAGLKVSVEEAAAAIGALSNAGLQASLAGTGLRRVLAELESPAAKSRRIFKSLGLDVEDVRVSAVGLTEAISRLAVAGLTTGQALEVFGDRGGPAFEILASSIDTVISLRKSLEDAAGTANFVATIMDANLAGSFLAVRSAAEELTLSIEEAFSDQLDARIVQKQLDLVTEAFKDGSISVQEYNDGLRDILTQGQPFTRFIFSLANAIRFLASNIDDLKDALLVLSPLLVFVLRTQLLGLLLAVGKALVSLGTIILLNPIVALAAVIIGVAAALTLFQDEIAITGDGLVTVGDFIDAAFDPKVIEDTADALNKKLNPALTETQRIMEKSNFESFLEGFSGAATTIASATKALFITVGISIVRLFDTVIAGAVGALNTIIDGLNKLRNLIGNSPISPIPEAARLETSSKTLGKSAATIFQEAFNEGLQEDDTFANFIRQTFASARLKAIERRAQERFKQLALNIRRTIKDNLTSLDDGGGGGSGEASLKLTELQTGALATLRDTLDPVRAAMLDLVEAEKLLNQAQKANVITLEERDTLLSQTRDKLADQLNPLKAVNDELDRERNLLGLTSREREVEIRLLEIVDVLRKSGLVLSSLTVDALRDELGALQNLNEEDLRRLSILAELAGPQEEFIRKQETIAKLLADGALTSQQATRAFRDLRIEVLDLETSASAGLERGFLKVQKGLVDFASTTERLVTDAFSGASEALARFVETGKLSFGDLFRTISAGLIRLGTQQLLASLFTNVGGNGGGLGGLLGSSLASLFPGFANGGSFVVDGSNTVASLPGIDNRFVAFRARDGETVTVTPPGRAPQSSSSSAPTVIFNVANKEDAFAFSQSQILNRMDAKLSRARNRR